MSRSQIRINGGFFVFKREILDLIEPGDELSRRRSRSSSRGTTAGVPVRRVLRADGHDRRPQRLEALHESGHAPWLESTLLGTLKALPTDARPQPVGLGSLRSVLAIGCHADDIEIGCGGNACPRSRGRIWNARSTGSCSRRRASG